MAEFKAKKVRTNQGITHIILIIVGLILSAILIGLFVSNSKSTYQPIKPAVINQQAPNVPNCGLTIVSPQPNQTIPDGFIVKGIENGCGWVAFESVGGSVEVVKSNGQLVSDRIPFKVLGDWMKIPVNFEVVLNLNQIPALGTSGSLIFRNDDPSGEMPKIVVIPVKF